MSLFSWMQRSVSAQQVVAWGIEVARKCHGEVAERLTATHQLSLTEARGYIRARSATILDQEIARLQATTGCGQLMAIAVRAHATEEVIRMSIGEILKAMRQSPPIRRAA
jgi:hypothetical protein